MALFYCFIANRYGISTVAADTVDDALNQFENQIRTKQIHQQLQQTDIRIIAIAATSESNDYELLCNRYVNGTLIEYRDINLEGENND